MSTFIRWVQQLNFAWVIALLITAASAALCISFHEMCHAWVAYLLGDPTAKMRGRLSLNPLHHVDWIGLVMLIVLKFGWAKPVPVDSRRFRSPKLGMAAVAAAGPLSNVVLALAALLIYNACVPYQVRYPVVGYVCYFFLYTAILSCSLAVFNLIPIPPLDGWKVLAVILPPKVYWFMMRYERYGRFVLLALLILGVLDGPLAAMRDGLLSVLQRISIWPYYLFLGA